MNLFLNKNQEIHVCMVFCLFSYCVDNKKILKMHSYSFPTWKVTFPENKN